MTEQLTPESMWIWRQVYAWSETPEPRALPALLAVLREEDSWFPDTTRIRRLAAKALGILGLGAVDELIAEGTEVACEGAADALGFVGDPEAVARLHALSLQPSARVVLWAALSLAKHGDQAVPALADALSRTASFETAAHLADALRLIGSDLAAEALRQFVARAPADIAPAVEAVLAARGNGVGASRSPQRAPRRRAPSNPN